LLDDDFDVHNLQQTNVKQKLGLACVQLFAL